MGERKDGSQHGRGGDRAGVGRASSSVFFSADLRLERGTVIMGIQHRDPTGRQCCGNVRVTEIRRDGNSFGTCEKCNKPNIPIPDVS